MLTSQEVLTETVSFYELCYIIPGKMNFQKWQHMTQFKKQEAEFSTMKNEMPAKKSKLVSQYDSKKSNTKLTSASFFQRLQAKTTEEVKVKLKLPILSLKKLTKHSSEGDLMLWALCCNFLSISFFKLYIF